MEATTELGMLKPNLAVVKVLSSFLFFLSDVTTSNHIGQTYHQSQSILSIPVGLPTVT
jgi:hypothetical protein